MKSIAFLATATIAMAGTAFAKIGTPVETHDGGEMFFSLFSQSAGTTYQLDTGVLVMDFPALANNSFGTLWRFSLDATNDAAFAAFLVATGPASDISFSLMGGDNSGVTAASRSLITTVRHGGDVDSITNGNLVNGMSAMTTNYLDGISGVNSKHPAGMLSNGSSFFTQAEGNGHYYTAQTDTLSGNLAIGNDNRLGTLTAVYQFTRSSTGSLGDANEALLGFLDVRQVSRDQYDVDFGFRPLTSEAPEPSSMVLALIGLVAFGALADRRRAD
ncbi:PEP-CTERM sorting domain-containing protein [Aquabacterium sp. CECT 9606]|uniref:PEP-CTERM sorting domain-containing protein n=1 Tax=Aquabacterium sp. CECT 9606 TaxID=2845822 RepID=UPI001E44D1A4|nr:PEP-CTERM sorting domain-containing protein [Aquabacterium sp. CECT 9606]CAH0351546.1 hypothetical protein AQB9606_02208 [Aquabacterium sp. CECT 9606]